MLSKIIIVILAFVVVGETYGLYYFDQKCKTSEHLALTRMDSEQAALDLIAQGKERLDVILADERKRAILFSR
jgi:uncharacterized membrane protein YpjA